MEPIYIPQGKQDKLSAYVFMPEGDFQFMLVICHGFRGTKENGGRIFKFAERVNLLGMGVLAFDFSGSGASSGEFADISLTGQLNDLQQVIDYIDRHYNKQVIVLGRSFGGSTILAAAAKLDKRVAGYIFWSAPIMLYETFAGLVAEFNKAETAEVLELKDDAGCFQLKPAFIKDFANHNMISCARKLASCPVLIVHGAADEVVDSANAILIYENCSNAELHIITGADHRFTQNMLDREDITLKWLHKTFL